MIKTLEYIKEERKLLQEKYFADTKEIWCKYEGIEADKMHKKVLNNYKSKDKYLEVLEAKLESYISELEHYNNKIK